MPNQCAWVRWTLLAAALAVPAVGLWARAGDQARSAAAVQAPLHAIQPRMLAAGGMAVPPPKSIRYGRDIRPILSDRCFLCHGPDAKTRAADLRLDVRENAADPQRKAIVPGDPDASKLWQRISHANPLEVMPPPSSNKKPLSAEERELVRRWIAEGAVYEPHWAFVPPARPEPPAVLNEAWCRTPVDRFVLQRLEEAGAAPSPEAGREELIRRVFLDVTGLPPTPAEIDAFLADGRPDAYERWVDKLFDEEPYRTRYAEHMTARWLDAARYADTCGIHMDAGRQMWLWRDWVLQAYRGHMPFDRFTIEQIAGDLLPDATEAQHIASGFNRNHVTTDEGGAIAEEYLVEYAVDRTDTTGAVFLGLTVGCARCHDHKYDPITQEDYYRLFAYYNSIEEPGLYSQLPDANRAMEPFIVVGTAEQKSEVATLQEKVARLLAELDAVSPEEQALWQAFEGEAPVQAGVAWTVPPVVQAISAQGATLAVQPDGSVLASGLNPDKDTHAYTLRLQGENLRILAVEALPDTSLVDGRVGRAFNGNAVVSSIEAEAVSVAEPTRREPVRFIWAWADVEQANGDFRVVNVLEPADERGWAVDGHGQEGGRVAVLLADKPFGFAGGTDLHVRLRYDTIHSQHVLGRVRLAASPVSDVGLASMPAAMSGWYVVGPFTAAASQPAYQTAFGPEQDVLLDPKRNFGAGNQYWQYNPELRDGQIHSFGAGVYAIYLGRRIFSPTARQVEAFIGSDDGFALYLNGTQVAAVQADRGVVPDQDRVVLDLAAGPNTLVLKIVNSGGPAGYYFRIGERADELTGDLVAVLAPPEARSPATRQRLRQAWKLARLPGQRERRAEVAAAQQRITEVEAAMPRTMVMKELEQPRETFVLTRGVYDKPDRNRPVSRGVPAALGRPPEDAPANRLGLARWLVAPDNPLTARVIVNRYWEMLFGTGLVRTSEDFGLQGEWPSHPELLDWLAVEFREAGWSTEHMLKLMLTSSTYRQSSRIRPELREHDPDNRALVSYPRRRLSAEQIRDMALYISGLLVERLGGPSVKPYQPAGLWKEVAMIQSNTREFVRGNGPDLWRRSLYTYWKRACPPPSLLTFDAPTRESCVIRRANTNTPLQALALMNDEQFVEAARVLAQRVLRGSPDDPHRLAELYRWCVGRSPDEAEQALLAEHLAAYRERYQQAPQDAQALLEVGDTPVAEDLAAPELAAWTMIANAVMNLSATITQR